MSKILFDPTINGLGASLDVRSAKQALHSANLANANTPGYKTKDLDFKNALLKAFEKDSETESETPPSVLSESKIVESSHNNPSFNGNNVNNDEESLKIAENELLYNASTKLLQKKLGLLKYSINEGIK